MERTAWTDDRIADTLEAIRHGIGRHDEEIRELRSETRADIGQLRAEASQFRAEVHTEFADVRKEMREGFTELRGEMAAMRLMIMRLGGAFMIAWVSIIGTILLQMPS